MKLSKLIKYLQVYKEKFGDLELKNNIDSDENINSHQVSFQLGEIKVDDLKRLTKGVKHG